ncbi:hypothetical protein QH494_06155 [Sphingomonas sp. AR_OL41]|uniref:hypothetical protein n=1 Tax=Sphingomonas sp. AR_OL41 TaxID=3042729 RepID=UPI0024815E6A|nr:hypothetical protein [Sphingomonas sp. AR_OL41]MDH7971761.1 hypothetical protein [Sphingomonas sp. AR_OL41]
MLSACTTSPTPERPKIAADPIVENHTVTRVECPAEVTAPTPGPVPDYAGPEVVAPPPYFVWLGRHLAREALLGARIEDARESCPK